MKIKTLADLVKHCKSSNDFLKGIKTNGLSDQIYDWGSCSEAQWQTYNGKTWPEIARAYWKYRQYQ